MSKQKVWYIPVKFLENRVKTSRNGSAALTELPRQMIGHRCAKFEPTDDFGRSIQQLVHHAYAEMPVERQDTHMREHFVNGLRPDLNRIVLIADPKSFTHALDLAEREEINDQITNGSAPWVKPSPQKSVPIAAISAEQRLMERMDRLEGVVEKLAISLAEMRTSYQSYQKYGNERRNNQRDRNLCCSDGRPICSFCMKVGHVEAKCNEKKQLQDQSEI